MASAEVARAVADVTVGAPLYGTRDVAGMFAAAAGDALIAKEGAVIAKTSYREWLAG